MINRLSRSAGLGAFGIFFLGACSGGGGSGMAPVTSATTTTPSTQASSVPISLQGTNTTVAYQAASSAALVSTGGVSGTTSSSAGQGATITLTTNSNGVTTTVFNIPTTGASFTQQYTSSVWDYGGVLSANAPTTGLLVTILRDVFGFPNTTGALVTQSLGAQSLSSAAYGFWASGDTATTGRAGTLAFGNPTSAVSVPATGTATFNGATTGLGGATGGNAIYALEGKVQVIANFASHSATTNLTGLKTQNISTNAIGALPDLTGVSTISGNAYAGAIAGTGLNGTVNGNFYGSAAQETAGVWQASGGGNVWMGSYGAK